MKYTIWTIVGIILIGGLIWFGFAGNKAEDNTHPEAQALAEWLTDSGVKFYGAFWCPACNAQKELFGSAAKSLPYVECSTPNRKSQTEVCEAEDIKRYPTWEFVDGTRHEGVLTIDQLKELSNYPQTSVNE